MRKLLATAFALGLVFTMTAAWGASSEEISIPWAGGWLKEFNDGEASGELQAKLFRPSGSSPAPYVVFLHGCGGLNLKNQGHWADFFVKRGVGVLMVDSFATRKIANACQDKGPWARRRADDANAALAWLQSQPFVRSDRIALMGQSQGGGALLLALHEKMPGAKGYIAGVAMYPSCGYGNSAKVQLGTPLLILIGEDDNWTPLAECEKLRAAQTDSSKIEMITYPGAAHSFDNPVPSALVFNRYKVGEHAASRDKARERIAKFVDEVLKR